MNEIAQHIYQKNKELGAKKKGQKIVKNLLPIKGGWWGSNPRPSAPQTNTLTNWATTTVFFQSNKSTTFNLLFKFLWKFFHKNF